MGDQLNLPSLPFLGCNAVSNRIRTLALPLALCSFASNVLSPGLSCETCCWGEGLVTADEEAEEDMV